MKRCLLIIACILVAGCGEIEKRKAYRLSMQYCDEPKEVCSCVVKKYIDRLTDSEIMKINQGIMTPSPMFGCFHFAGDCFR